MAHQATNIPWGVLASNLKFSQAENLGNGGLHLRFKPQQAKELHYFVEGFIRNVRNHAQTGRKKYPDTYEDTHPDTIILDDAMVNGDAFFNQEIVKTLLLYGEMDTILRVCALPNVGLREWWSVPPCYDEPCDAGWDQVCSRALIPYIALNLIYCFPEIWDDASGRTDEKDYRLMRMYQCMVRECTYSRATSEVAAYPHRQFFGIEDDQFRFRRSTIFGQFSSDAFQNTTRQDLFGKMSFETFLSCDTLTQQKPTPSAIAQVNQILRSKGLPTELIWDILERAEYEPGSGRLKVPHDPFHPENRDELAKYLRYCWELVVRCEMMANAIGMEIPWMEVLQTALVPLLESDTTPRRKWYDQYEAPFTFV